MPEDKPQQAKFDQATSKLTSLTKGALRLSIIILFSVVAWRLAWSDFSLDLSKFDFSDLIALTGDVFDENHDDLAPFLPALAQLTATWGVYAVTGNHEFYADTEDGLKSLESAGVKVLRNDVEVIPEIAVVVGLDDPTGIQAAKLARPDFNTLKSRIPAGLPVIVLNHQPVYLEQVQAMGGDLQLSGHTHDGQIWPFKYLNKLVFKYQNGLHKLGDLFLYVSSGTGYWGPPFRIGTTSEITVFYLNS